MGVSADCRSDGDRRRRAPTGVAAGRAGELPKARSLAEVALSAYVADQRDLSDGDGGEGNRAVPKTRPNIPKPNMAATEAELDKAAQGFPAGDN